MIAYFMYLTTLFLQTAVVSVCPYVGYLIDTSREFKQIATAGATTAAVTEKVWRRVRRLGLPNFTK